MKKKLVNSNQLNLFDLIKRQEKIPSHEGSCDIRIQFRHILSNCISKSNNSRYQICSKISELLGNEVTISMLNSWTAESHEQHRFPAEYLPAFCRAVGSYEPLEFLARKTGLFLMPGTEALRSEIQRLEEEITRLQKEKDKRVFFLNEADRKF